MLQLFLNLLPVWFLPHEQVAVAVVTQELRVVCEGVRLGRQLYRLSLKQLSVCGVEVFGDDAPGYAVAADMVTGQQEDVPVAGMAQGCLEQRAVLQVDGVQLIGGAEAYKCPVADIPDDDFPIMHDGTEHVMVNNQSLKGLSEQHGIDRSQASQCYGLVEMFRLGKVPTEECLLDGIGTDLSRDGFLRDDRLFLVPGCPCNGPHGLQPHDVAHLRDKAHASQTAHQTDGLDGVASQGEEVIECADWRCEVQHFCKDDCNLFLGLSFRNYVFRITGYVGSRQLLPVNLAVGGERKCLQLHIG